MFDVKTLCLGILTMGDASGYEIKKTFEERFSHFFAASFGSIYPALNKLTQEGLVTCAAQAQSKRPDKKVYSITPSGKIAFMDALGQPVGPDRHRSEFLALMMFSHLLTLRQLSDAIDSKLAEYHEELAAIADCENERPCSPGEEFVAGFGKAIYEAAIRYVEEHRHVVEGPALLSSAPEKDLAS